MSSSFLQLLDTKEEAWEIFQSYSKQIESHRSRLSLSIGKNVVIKFGIPVEYIL